MMGRRDCIPPGAQQRKGEEMSKEVVLPPEYQVWFALHEVDTGILKAIENELRPFQISAPATGLMYVLQASGEPVTLNELSRWLFRRPHSVSELVSRMARQGLVRKVKDQKRKGSVRVKLTKKGEQVLDQYMKEMKVVSKIISCLSKGEADVFMKCLEKLRKKTLEAILESTVNTRGIGSIR